MPSSHLSSFSEWQYAFSMLGSNVLSSSQCLIAELIGLLNRDFILTFEFNGPFGAVRRVAASGRKRTFVETKIDAVAVKDDYSKQRH